MGCQRTGHIDGEIDVGLTPTPVVLIPNTAVEGQMTFRNVGATTIRVAVGRPRGSQDVAVRQYSIYLGPGDPFSEEGIVPGQVVAISDVAGGQLSYYISYSEVAAFKAGV